MSYDLEAGKPTEIDALQGLIIRLGAEKSVPTPLCIRIRAHINQAQAAGRGLPNMAPADI
jgi:2-dehydropantoate 2-reductase